MIREHGDVAVLGAGFAGSIMAQVLQRIGRTVVLLERGVHPRFAIGESSTPLANLALEEISRTYDLPQLFPLAAYGSWLKAYPHLAVGLKRGFTFMRHQAGQRFRPSPDHANELLVAASPADDVADTHWFREHFDHFLVQQAQSAGIPYRDRTDIASIERQRQRWLLRGQREGEPIEVTASFLIDASGPGGVLARALGLDTSPAAVRTNSWSVFSHFVDVGLFEDEVRDAGGSLADYPYRCDDAALHHLLEDGWMWVLRFNNGVTSAGFMLDGARQPSDASVAPEVEWQRMLERYPSIGRQFARARPVRPWLRTGRLQRRSARAAGDGWAMLAHAAYFLDALFSGGNAHGLLTIQRLACILEQHWGQPSLARQLLDYEAQLLGEADYLDRLIHGCYRSLGRFELFTAYVMYYFAGAMQSETRRRQGGPDEGFLFAHHAPYHTAVCRSHAALVELAARAPDPSATAAFQAQAALDVGPFNTIGLGDPARKNMYPFG